MRTTHLAILLVTVTAMMLVSGCGGAQPLLMNKSHFETLSEATFPAKDFRRIGTGSSFVGDELEFSQELEPLDPSKPINLGFSEFGKFLLAHDTFTGSGNGGSASLHWRSTWSNSRRFIMVYGSVLKNGNVRLVYLEVVR